MQGYLNAPRTWLEETKADQTVKLVATQNRQIKDRLAELEHKKIQLEKVQNLYWTHLLERLEEER